MVSEWTVHPLGDCMVAIIDYRGKTPRKAASGIPLVTAKVVKGGRIAPPDEFIDVDDYESWMRRGIPEPGDIVITTEAPLGEVAQLGSERVALAQRLITLRGKPGVLDNTFLKFVMQSEGVQNQLRARATGTTVLGIKQSELRKVRLTLPPLTEQLAIARILGVLDDKIEVNRRMIAKLGEAAQALFKSWFVDFDPARLNAEGRRPTPADDAVASFFTGRFQRSDIGEIPEGWRLVELGELLDFAKGKKPSALSAKPGSGLQPVILIDTFDSGRSGFASPAGMVEANSNDVLMVMDGASSGRVETGFEGVVGSTIAKIVPKRSPPGTRFLYYLLKHLEREVRQHQTGTSIPHTDKGWIVRQTVSLPGDDALLQLFEATADMLQKRIGLNRVEAYTLAGLRDTLLPKLISGELRVKKAEDLAKAHL